MERMFESFRERFSRLDLALPALSREASPELPLTGGGAGKARPTGELSVELEAMWSRVESRRVQRVDLARRVRRAAAIVAVAAALGALARFWWSRPPLPVSTAFPALLASGLAIVDTAFLSVDAETGELVTLDPGGAKPLRAIPFPNRRAAGLAAGGDTLWSTDPARRLFYRHDPITGAILERFPSPGPGPSSMLWDGDALWTADSAIRRLYRHDLQDRLRVAADFPLGEGRADALALWEGLLWAADARSLRVRRFRPDTGAEVGACDLSPLLPAGVRLAGLAVDKDGAWALTVSPSRLTLIPHDRLRFQ